MAADEHDLERWRPTEVTGAPGVLGRAGRQRLVSVWSLEIAGGEIPSISSVVNPDELAHLGEVGDFAALVGAARPAPRAPSTSHPDAHDPGGTP